MSPTRSIVPLLLTAVFAAPPQVLAQGRAWREPQDVLPTSSYCALGFAGLDRCRTAFAGHDAAQVVLGFLGRLPGEFMAERLTPKIDEAVQALRQGLDEGGVSPATLRNVLRRPMALGVGRLTIRGMGPSVALVIDEGPAAAEIDALRASLVTMLRQLGAEPQEGTANIAGHACSTLTVGEGPTLLMVHDGGLFVATNSEGYLAEIFATAQGQQPSLGRGPTLSQQRAHLGEPPLFEAFVHTAPFMHVLDPVLPYEAARIGDAFGVNSLSGIYGAVALDHGGTVEMLDLGLAGGANGMLKAALAGPADYSAARLCGDDTVAFGALHVDPIATVGGFEALLGALPDVAAGAVRPQIAMGLRRAARHLGVTREQIQELLHAFGGSVAFAVSMTKGAPIPADVLAVVSVRDRSVASAWIDRLVATSAEHGIEWKARDVDGSTIRFFDLPAGATPIRLPLAPALALVDDQLLLATNTRVILAALKQKADPDSSLANIPDFRAAVQANPAAAGFLHLRQGHGLEIGWRMLDMYVLSQLDAHQDEIGIGRDVLPDQEDIVKAAGTTTVSLTIDGAGVRLRGRGNVMIGGLMLAGARVFDELLERASGKVY